MNLPRWNVGSGMPEIEPNVGAVIMMFSRTEVEGLRSGRAVDDLMQLSDSARLRRQLSQLAYYTDGNVPAALASVPKEWSAQDISDFQRWWDELQSGHQAQQRKLKFIPDCRRYLQAVHSLWPYWLHFLAPEPGMWAVMLLCLAGGGETVPGTAGRTGHSTDGAAIRGIVQEMLRPMNLLHAEMGLSEQESVELFMVSMGAIEETLR